MHDSSTLLHTLLQHATIPPDQQLLLQGVEFVETPSGTLLQQQGCAADWLGVLERGVVRMFRNIDGREVNLGFEFEGGFIGAFEAYMQQKPAQYSLQTLEHSQLWRFDRTLLDGLMAGHSCWRELSGRIAQVELARKIDKELEVRTKSPEQRYAHLLHIASPLVRRLPQYHLASYLGVAPETLSRIRTRMS